MHPIAFVIEAGGGMRVVGTFGLFLALAILVGSCLTTRGAVRAGIPLDDAISAAAFGCAAALVGGYILDAAVHFFADGVGFTFANVGLTFYGAPIAGIVALALAAKPLGVPFLRYADAGIVGVPVAHALGRMGCFFAGCCHGHPTTSPLGVVFDDANALTEFPGIPVHPTQLYEAGGLLVLGFVFAAVPPARVGDGRRALTYALAYAALRLAVERFRGDGVRGSVFGSVSTSEFISLVVLAIGVPILLRSSPNRRIVPPTRT